MAGNNPYKAVLFDLDGTLLRVNMSAFIPRYVDALAEFCADKVKPKKFKKSLQGATRHLIYEAGDGHSTNEDRMIQYLKRELGLSEETLHSALEHFAKDGFDKLKETVRPISLAQKIISDCSATGVPLVLATNPVFPRFMVEGRMRWGGLNPDDFIYVSCFENSYHCKPQSGYFTDLTTLLKVEPQQCLMVGNDMSHDMAAADVGMTTFLVDTWMVDDNLPHGPCHHRGDHSQLQNFLQRSLS